MTGVGSGSLWGTDVYTDDSTLGLAAVHAGVVSVGQTKNVVVTVLAGQSSYSGTSRNGVTSSGYGAWQGSFRIAPAPSSGSTTANTCNVVPCAAGQYEPEGARSSLSSLSQL